MSRARECIGRSTGICIRYLTYIHLFRSRRRDRHSNFDPSPPILFFISLAPRYSTLDPSYAGTPDAEPARHIALTPVDGF